MFMINNETLNAILKKSSDFYSYSDGFKEARKRKLHIRAAQAPNGVEPIGCTAKKRTEDGVENDNVFIDPLPLETESSSKVSQNR